MGEEKISSLVSFNSDLHLQNNRDSGICHKGLLTDAGKRLQLTKMLMLTVFPIMVLWSFTVYTLTESIDDQTNSNMNRVQLLFTNELGQLIHHLQRERDMSVLYLSALGPETKTFLLNEYLDTDSALASLSRWPEDLTSLGLQDQIFGSREILLAHISRHRQLLDKNNYNIFAEIDFYNYIIDTMLNWLTNTISTGEYSDVWRNLVAYTKITIGKQDVGVERALGTYFFVQGGFNDQTAFEMYNRRVHKFKAFYYTAHMYSNDVDNLYKEGYFSASYNVTAIVNTYRQEIQSSDERLKNPNISKAQMWFDNMTIYMDALLGIHLKLGDYIIQEIDQKLSSITESMAISITFLILVVFISPFVIISTEALTSNIQNYAITLVDKTKELSIEKKKTDSLLYQLVPKPIAMKLKKNIHIDAEYFKSATIFFTDIYNFSRLVMESTPIEIVELLKMLYNSIDERLDSFDVYKVETINDCYMVSSGLPKRNRDRHVLEIANLALVLRDMMLKKPFVLSGDRAIKLRFGINTGPCMAGVVGLIMPRYCLFGDTINTASRMKSYGQPNKIHVSQATYISLKKYGYFTFKKRGSVEIKGKGEMQTYWLTGKQSDSRRVFEFDEGSASDGEATPNPTMPGELSQYEEPHLRSALSVPLPGRNYSTLPVKSSKGLTNPTIIETKNKERKQYKRKNEESSSSAFKNNENDNDVTNEQVSILSNKTLTSADLPGTPTRRISLPDDNNKERSGNLEKIRGEEIAD